jgi:geranylgeranyl pyrophosphate synthase
MAEFSDGCLRKRLQNFGLNLGMAFQLIDDLLDLLMKIFSANQWVTI